MNSKKFISLMSAAALAASSFTALTSIAAFASDGDTVIFSDNFNKYENTVTHKTSPEGIGQVLIDGTATARSTYSLGNATLYTTGREDDSSYFKSQPKEEGSSDKYIETTVSRFSSASRGAYIGFDAIKAESGKDVVLSFDMKETNAGETGYDDAFSIGGTIVNLKTAKLNDGNWHKYKVVVTTSGTSVYVDGNETAVVTGSDTSADDITFNGLVNGEAQEAAQKATSHPFGYITFGIDNLVIYTSADGTASVPPTAEDNNATPKPEETEAPAADIEVSAKIDADETFFDDEESKITLTSASTTSVVPTTIDGWDTDVYSVVQTSGKDNAYSYAKIDFSKVTAGKSHIILKYDLRAGSDGRIKTVINDGTLGGTATGTGSLFSQGITSSTSTVAIIKDDWVTTTVDINLAAGTGTYTVVKSSDGTEVASGKFTTDLKKITALSLLSWSPNTSYIDNIEVQAGGTMEETPKATAEPAAETEGSNVEFLPSDVVSIGTMETAEGEAEEKLNHSEAKKVTAASVAAYSDKARGKSIFAAYDVYVAPGSSMNIAATGNNGQATSSTIKLTADDDNKVILSAVTDKGTVTADKELVCDTWYRVLLEVPQSGTSDATSTGSLTFTVYRINADDQSAASEVAAQLTGLSARGVATRGVTALSVEVTGDVYIDNSQVFLYTTGYSLIAAPAVEVTPEPAATVEGSGVDLRPETATAIGDFASAEASEEAILNHSNAKLVQAATDITAYNEKAKNKAVYAAYDIYVEKASSFTLIPHGDNGNAAGPTLQFAADSNGAVTVSAITGSSSSSTAKETLAAGTWYRVMVEMPQTSSGTDKINYTVYRIDANDQNKVSGVAAELTGLSSRGLATKFVTSLETQVEGKAYIDNGTIYYGKASAEETWTKYTAEYDADGRLTAATAEVVADPATVDTTENTDTSKTFVWNNGLKPYVPETAE